MGDVLEENLSGQNNYCQRKHPPHSESCTISHQWGWRLFKLLWLISACLSEEPQEAPGAFLEQSLWLGGQRVQGKKKKLTELGLLLLKKIKKWENRGGERQLVKVLSQGSEFRSPELMEKTTLERWWWGSRELTANDPSQISFKLKERLCLKNIRGRLCVIIHL